TMVWAWPGVHARYFPRHHQTLTGYLKPLNLTTTQMPEVLAVYKNFDQQRHQIHMGFTPAYEKVCDDFMATSQQERVAYEPIRHQALDQLQKILTTPQWQKFQAMRTAGQKNQPHYTPDVCRHLPKK
ncbi:MAG: hypothetical protein ACRD2D_09615, partial [Terriglobales bacterium]